MSTLYRFSLLLAIFMTPFVLQAQSFWTPTSLPHQRDVTSIIVSSQGSILAATPAGIYRSTDHGYTWHEVESDFFGPDIATLWAGADGTLWAGTYARSPLVGYTWRSSNDGASWQKVFGPSNIEAFAEGAAGVYAAGIGGVWNTSDNGATWSGPTLDSFRVSAIATAANGDVVAGTVVGPYERIYRSSDAGATWTQSDEGMKYANINVIARAPNGDLWAGTYSHMPTDSNVYRSTDNGRTWTPQAMEDTWVTSFAFNDAGDLFVAAKGLGYEGTASPSGVWRSRDRGVSWSDISAGLPTRTVLALASDRNGYLYAATSSGLFRSTGSTVGVESARPGPTGVMLEVVGANPGSDAISLRYSLRSAEPASLTIVDARGEIVEQLPVAPTAGDFTIEWSTAGRASGLYYCRLSSESSVVTRGVMVVK